MTKIRIWDKQYKRWADTFQFKFNERGEITWDVVLMSPSPKSMDEFIIQQSTSLFDKNGEEIYEGDIVAYTLTYNCKESINLIEGTVSFENGEFSHLPINRINEEDDWYSYYISNYEVIGNIFDKSI